MTTKTKIPVAELYGFEGEELEFDPELGYTLLARYRQAAQALHAAKAAALEVEAEIQAALGGFEHGVINGQRVFHWPWCDKTSFNVKALKAAHPAIHAEFSTTVPNGSRRFTVEGTVGVD